MNTPTRKEGWETRLAAYIESRTHEPFAWGRHDCCAFVCGAIEAMAGDDLLAQHRPYSTAVGAAHVIAEVGGVAKMAEHHGFRRLPSVACAMRGDVVVVATDGGKPGRVLESLGVCVGIDSVFAASPRGIGHAKTLDCLSAWRIE